MVLPDWAGDVGTVAGIAGLGINIYLLIQLNRLNEAKQEEREFMQKILNIEKLDYILTAAADTLRENENTDFQLIKQIDDTKGQMRGALGVLDEMEGRDPSEGREYHIKHFGYYDRGFLTEQVPNATEVVRLICFRNSRICTDNSVVEVLADRIREGVTVEMYSMSPTLPDEVLRHVGENLPNPTPDGEEVRREIQQNAKEFYSIMTDELSTREADNIDYWFYEEIPKIHLVQIDNIIYVEVSNYTQTDLDNNKHDGEELKPYIEVPVSSPVGQFLINNIKHLEENSCRDWRDCIDLRA